MPSLSGAAAGASVILSSLPSVLSRPDKTRLAISERDDIRYVVNTIIQGSAADIMKSAMIRVHTAIASTEWGQHGQPKIILTIHDELLLHCHTTQTDTVAHILTTQMTRQDILIATDKILTVPLEVTLREGNSWGNMKPMQYTVGLNDMTVFASQLNDSRWWSSRGCVSIVG